MPSAAFAIVAVILALCAVSASAQQQQQPATPDNAYWRARAADACGYIPPAAAVNLEALARSAEAESQPVPAEVAALGIGADSGFEGMLTIGATTLRDVAAAMRDGMSAEAAAERFADPVRIGMETAETGAFLRTPPPPPRSDAPLEVVRQAYFINLGQQFSLNVLALRTLRALLLEGTGVLNDPGADRLARNGWIAAEMFYANVRADRLRDNLASGVARAGVAETEALICLTHAVDMFLNASVAVLNGRQDTAAQRGLAVRSVREWRRIVASPEVAAAAFRFNVKPALDAYYAKAVALANHLEEAGKPAGFAATPDDARAAIDLLDATLSARADYVRAVLGNRLN